MIALRDTKERFYPELANDVFVDGCLSQGVALTLVPVPTRQLVGSAGSGVGGIAGGRLIVGRV